MLFLFEIFLSQTLQRLLMPLGTHPGERFQKARIRPAALGEQAYYLLALAFYFGALFLITVVRLFYGSHGGDNIGADFLADTVRQLAQVRRQLGEQAQPGLHLPYAQQRHREVGRHGAGRNRSEHGERRIGHER